MVYRVYVEKKKELANEASELLSEIHEFLGIKSVSDVRVINRYDVENIDRELFGYAVKTVFSEPQQDTVSYELPDDGIIFAVEFLPGQFDQRADSAAQCIQIISKKERPAVQSAKIYVLYGDVSAKDLETVKKHVINPVECREAMLRLPETLKMDYAVPGDVKTVEGFKDMDADKLNELIESMGLAMDEDDIAFCRDYFKNEGRDPSITEIRMIDTYWSDHCRHTTFLTTIDDVKFEDELLSKTYEEYLEAKKASGDRKPVTLMNLATVAVKYLKKQGKLEKLDESDEINACTVKIEVTSEGKKEDWLLLFKNETHNHPTEIEPFGGAATCIGGAIRDPLSGRSYVYGAMRVTGAADPTRPVSKTLRGKLPQRKIVRSAAAGYSSYGNQIGLATGIVDEIYHDGYAAKRMEIGAVIGAAPAKNVRRECPKDGDIVILLGGKTGRDGCGGATGSSKSHNLKSIETCGAEVQKGNAPEERKLQRLFRNKEASLLIKRCNDFGAGGVSVAIGELADGLQINLDAVPKKYEGLDGTELAISESQERMAVVTAPEDVEKFIYLADKENLEATVVAKVTAEPRLIMTWRGKKIVDLKREFLNSNGAEKHISVEISAPMDYNRDKVNAAFEEKYKKLAADLNVCSKRGLSEMFDSSIGAGSVLMPLGGKNQLTPAQAMVHKISRDKGDTDTCSLMAWGFNPFISEKSPYHGAYLAVIESVSKLIATGAEFKDVYLTFQDYFEKPGADPKRWGKPMAALLGAFKAQKELSAAAIGGKDSMSGSFEKLDVPPTLVSFAVTTDEIKNIASPEFKKAGNRVYLIAPEYDENGLPETKSLLKTFDDVTRLLRTGKAVSAATVTYGGIAEQIMKMSLGNGIGFEFSDALSEDEIFGYNYGAFLLEICGKTENGICIGETTENKALSYGGESLKLSELSDAYDEKLEEVYPTRTNEKNEDIKAFSYKTDVHIKAKNGFSKPHMLIPVFPGTNCEYDTEKSAERAGIEAEIFVIGNLSANAISESVSSFAEKIRNSQIIFIPGGFSGGDEPDGSGKFITAFFRNEEIKNGVHDLLLKRDGLMCGICNGFQALIKLGLVPFGEIIDTDSTCPTLTFNTIARHQSKIVRTRVCSDKSPWLSKVETGDIFNVPISHGEGRFMASEDVLSKLEKGGQIATQYVDLNGNPTYDINYNPNGSVCAIEGITSPDGRVLGKMGHSERIGAGLYKNVPGEYDIKLFEGAADYFKI